jgi:hypothetical protein
MSFGFMGPTSVIMGASTRVRATGAFRPLVNLLVKLLRASSYLVG